jgi:hypothetical protein
MGNTETKNQIQTSNCGEIMKRYQAVWGIGRWEVFDTITLESFPIPRHLRFMDGLEAAYELIEDLDNDDS